MTAPGEDHPLAARYDVRTVRALHEILATCRTARNLADRGRAWFDSDPDAVPQMAAETLVIRLGENVARLNPRFCADHPEVPWRVIKDMRNRLAHYYEATDPEVVWSTLTVDLPTLERQARSLLGAR